MQRPKHQVQRVNRSVLWCVCSLMPLAGCAGAVIAPPRPPKAEAASFDPSAVVVQDSSLRTAVTVSLAPLEHAVTVGIRDVVEAAYRVAAKPASSPAEPASSPSEAPSQSTEPTSSTVEAAPMVVAEVRSGHRTSPAFEGGRFDHQAWLDGLEISFHGSQLLVRADLSFTAAVTVPSGRRERTTSCGCNGQPWCGGQAQARRRARVRWTVPLLVGADWSLDGTPSVSIDEVDPCALRGPDATLVDVRKLIVDPLVEQIAAALLAAIEKDESVRDAARALWRQVSQPVPFGEDEGRALVLRPHGIRPGMLDIHGTDGKVALHLALNPIITGAPSELRASAWPPPAVVDATGFRVIGELALTREQLLAPLRARFVGRRFPARDFRFIQVTDVHLYGTRDRRAVVHMTLDGSAQGDIYFEGALRADEDAEELRLTGVEPTPESLRSLDALYDEIQQPDLRVSRVPWVNVSELLAELNAASHWPLRRSLIALRQRLQQVVRMPLVAGHDLWVAVKESNAVDAVIDEEGARVLVILHGRAGLDPMEASAAAAPAAPAAPDERSSGSAPSDDGPGDPSANPDATPATPPQRAE